MLTRRRGPYSHVVHVGPVVSWVQTLGPGAHCHAADIPHYLTVLTSSRADLRPLKSLEDRVSAGGWVECLIVLLIISPVVHPSVRSYVVRASFLSQALTARSYNEREYAAYTDWLLLLLLFSCSC